MSLRSIAVMRAEAEPAPAPASGTDPKPATPEDEQKKLLDQLIALVPTEAVAVYVAAIGAASSAPELVRWVCFLVVLVLTPVWVVVTYWEKKGGRTKIPFLEVVVGTLAFIAWTTTVPRGTLEELGGSPWVGTLIVVLASGALALVVRAKAVWAKKIGPAPTPEFRSWWACGRALSGHWPLWGLGFRGL